MEQILINPWELVIIRVNHAYTGITRSFEKEGVRGTGLILLQVSFRSIMDRRRIIWLDRPMYPMPPGGYSKDVNQ